MHRRISLPFHYDRSGEGVSGPDGIDSSIGLDRFATPLPGIFGVLKMRAEDFRVEEVGKIPALDPKGRFTLIKVTLRDWETNRFVRRFTSALKINRNRIWFSGTKDKKAVTTQLMVVDAPVSKVEEIEISDVDIDVIGRTHQKVAMGAHSANRFTIVVRGCVDENGVPLDARDAMAKSLAIREMMEESLGTGIFPNWVGPQRFGSLRPVTPIVGRFVLDDDFQSAVSTYLGMEGLFEDSETQEFRKTWRETAHVENCLEIIPKHLGYERSMLESYLESPENHVKAFSTMPRNLQLMMIHSLQSMAFNHVLATRLEFGLPLAEPMVGDVVAPMSSEGKIDAGKSALVDDTNLERCIRNCRFRRLSVTGPLPGVSGNIASGKPGDIESEVFRELELDKIDWNVHSIPRLTTNGTRRPYASIFEEFSIVDAPLLDEESLDSRWSNGPREGEIWHPEGACLKFRFTLPPGTYATVLMREFMKSPSSQY